MFGKLDMSSFSSKLLSEGRATLVPSSALSDAWPHSRPMGMVGFYRLGEGRRFALRLHEWGTQGMGVILCMGHPPWSLWFGDMVPPGCRGCVGRGPHP
jgi:hypothetical protein